MAPVGRPGRGLPGLVVALDERHGPVSKIMLGVADWDSSRPGRLRVDGPAGRRMLRLGWSPAMPAGLLTAIYADGHRTDLLIVPRIPVSRRPRRPWHKPHRSATVHRPGPGTGLIFLCA